MAWNDKPSDAQIGALLNLIRWEITNQDVPRIVAYLESHATRRTISEELGRLRELKINRKMNRDSAFDSLFWGKFTSNKI